MKKKFIISIFVILFLILVVGGIIWWQGDKIESFLESKKLEKMVASSKDYSVIEESAGKFIVNKKDGLKVKVPADWKAEIGGDIFGFASDRNVTLYSRDFSYRPPIGCAIEMEISRLQKERVEKYGEDLVIYPFEGAEEVREMINFYKEAKPEENEEIRMGTIKVISIDQKDALQKIEGLEGKNGKIGKHISIKIPTENKVYIFECILFSEECDEELNQFLETVSISDYSTPGVE